MLKIKNRKILESEAMKSVNTELLFKDLLEKLLDEEISIEAASVESEILENGLGDYYLIKNSEALKIYFNLSDLFPSNEKYEYFLFLMAVASAFKKHTEADWQGFNFSEPENTTECFILKKYRMTSPSRKQIEVSLAYPANLSLFCPDTERPEALCESKCNKISLQLGSIELDLESFIKLKEGMQIEFDMPESFNAGLSLEGSDIAEVKATLENNKLKLLVTNLATS